MPIPNNWNDRSWTKFVYQLSESLEKNATRKVIKTKQGHIIEYDEMKAFLSKDVINQIDISLAECYEFTTNEVDFIINYDIKYRMGQDECDDGE